MSLVSVLRDAASHSVKSISFQDRRDRLIRDRGRERLLGVSGMERGPAGMVVWMECLWERTLGMDSSSIRSFDSFRPLVLSC